MTPEQKLKTKNAGRRAAGLAMGVTKLATLGAGYASKKLGKAAYKAIPKKKK